MNTPAPRQEITYDTTEVLFVLPLDVVMNRPCKRSTRQFFSGLAVTISPGEDEEEREAAFFFFFFFFFFSFGSRTLSRATGKAIGATMNMTEELKMQTCVLGKCR